MPIAKRTNAETAAPASFDFSSTRRICCLALVWMVVASSTAGQATLGFTQEKPISPDAGLLPAATDVFLACPKR